MSVVMSSPRRDGVGGWWAAWVGGGSCEVVVYSPVVEGVWRGHFPHESSGRERGT